MSFGLPPSTEVNKSLTKKAIIEKFGLSGKERIRFDSTIHKAVISNEISPRTVNIPEGKEIKSIFVLRVELKEQKYDEKAILLLFKLIDQNLILVLEYGIMCRPVVFRNNILIQGDWTSDLRLNLNGLNMDDVWVDLIKQVGNIVLEGDNDLDSQISHDAECREITLGIEKLKKNIASEKQPRRKLELYKQIQRLNERLSVLKNR